MSGHPVELYDNVHGDFAGDVERIIRSESWGEDIGQSTIRGHGSGPNSRPAKARRIFEGLQRFLRCVHTLSAERRLSRFAYLAEKPGRGAALESGKTGA